MHELGLEAMREGAKKSNKQKREQHRNRVKREFSVDKPNKVWVSDLFRGFARSGCLRHDDLRPCRRPAAGAAGEHTTLWQWITRTLLFGWLWYRDIA